MRLYFDTETDGLLDAVTKVHCLVALNLDTMELHKFGPGEIEAGLKLLDKATLQVTQNGIRFDYPVLKKFYGWEPKCQIRDTLVMSKLIWPNLKSLDKGSVKVPSNLVGSHSLKAWGLRLGMLKGDFAEKNDWSTYSEEMLEYCVNDVKGPGLALWKLIEKKNYSEEAIQTEHDFTFVAFLMEQHGFRFDVKAAQKLHATLVKRKLELEAQLQAKYKGWTEDMKTPEWWDGSLPGRGVVVSLATKGATEEAAWKIAKVVGLRRKDITVTPGPLAKKHTPFSPSSRHHIIRVLTEEHGWKPTKFTDGGDPKLDEEILEKLEVPEAKLLVSYLMICKRLGQLAEGDAAWLKLVKPDGYLHGRIDSMGTVTSRCSHSGPNMAQIPAVALGKDKKPLLGEAGRFGWECRSLFIPDEGHVLVGADASGIQLRVVAHYMGAFDGGEYAKIVTQGDVHTENMKAIGLPDRATAKTWVYAYLLGAGDGKLGSISGTGAKGGKEDKERMWLRFPALKALKDALKNRVAEVGGIKGLDGRFCPTESAHLAMGSLLQSFESIVMKKATFLLYQTLTGRGYVHGVDFAFTAMVHDEWCLSCRKDIADEVGRTAVQSIADAGVYFKSRCELSGEYRIGDSWAVVH